MNKQTRIILVLLSLLCVCTSSVNAQALLSPPFGLKWGDNPSKLLDWADQSDLDITINLPGKERDKRHVVISNPNADTLPGHQATSIEARYEKGMLYEVTLHYADPKLNVMQAKAKFLNAKKALTARHGPFKLSAKRRDNDDGFLTESISYHIEPVSGLFLMLTYTEITDTMRKSGKSRFSLIYRNDNLLKHKK
ncbi:hypothetical protein Rhal01_01822 [Rubritalea halochordaticola]|uniref:Uncharacterized protein n=1 Tax=Rubritalea halochordaticola TaxID=714537 RepID=A0ABP9UZJ3_9BACT